MAALSTASASKGHLVASEYSVGRPLKVVVVEAASQAWSLPQRFASRATMLRSTKSPGSRMEPGLLSIARRMQLRRYGTWVFTHKTEGLYHCSRYELAPWKSCTTLTEFGQSLRLNAANEAISPPTVQAAEAHRWEGVSLLPQRCIDCRASTDPQDWPALASSPSRSAA